MANWGLGRLKRNSKETCLLTPRGGFLDGRNQNRDPEPSAKTFQDSDRREPPNSRGIDVLPKKKTTLGGRWRIATFFGERPATTLKENRSRRRQAELKETCLLTPRGGFFDGRNQNRDPEPSAKPLRNSDKPTNLEILFFLIGLEPASPGGPRKGPHSGQKKPLRGHREKHISQRKTTVLGPRFPKFCPAGHFDLMVRLRRAWKGARNFWFAEGAFFGAQKSVFGALRGRAKKHSKELIH